MELDVDELHEHMEVAWDKLDQHVIAYCRGSGIIVFAARYYANMVYAMALFLSVRHRWTFYQNS